MQIFSVHEIYKQEHSKTDVRPQCFVIQYEHKICVYTHYSGEKSECDKITEKGLMKPVKMRRGFNNTFYYVESDITGSADIIMQLKIENNSGVFVVKKKVAHELNSGSIIALEIDPDNNTKLDEGPTTNEDEWGSKFVPNELFFIDDSLQLLQLK